MRVNALDGLAPRSCCFRSQAASTVTPSSRVDCDAIAKDYDLSPYREKSPDPELAAFPAAEGPAASPLVLDIACGTGDQLVANRSLAPYAQLVGIDGSLGMSCAA